MLYEELSQKREQRDINIIIEQFDNNSQFEINGLNQKFPLRGYQKEAIARFHFVLDEKELYFNKENVHLVFNVATGAGKTLLMAENILYLYSKGYRNFIFFVHQNCILNKTKDNFLNKKSNKYLFEQELVYNSQRVRIKEVSNFSNIDSDDIHIMFTTCSGLHRQINKPSENKINLESLKDIKLALIADEAHHLDAATQGFEEDRESWEFTVDKLLKANKDNILLGYSATIDTSIPELKEKYHNKIIMKYGLKEFSEDKFAKDIYLFKSDMDNNERLLVALIMALYKEMVALKELKRTIKPVILVKSDKITNSQKDKEDFLSYIKSLSHEEIDKIKNNTNNAKVLTAFEYLNNHGINIVEMLKINYTELTIRIVNSSNSENKKEEVLQEMNTLENNNVRLIFTVNMLNEGWDVLNLFEIVRFDSAKQETTSSVQLIGRGCRYFPFRKDENDDLFRRKYDDEMENPLRCLEELNYHSRNDNKFIAKLKEDLAEKGLSIKDSEKEKTVKIYLKKSFQQTNLYKNGLIYENKLIKKDKTRIKSIKDYCEDLHFTESYKSNGVEAEYIFDKNNHIDNIYTIEVKNENIDTRLFYKARDLRNFYYFRNLKTYFPNYEGFDDFINDFRKNVKITISGCPDSQFKFCDMRRKEQLDILLNIFDGIENRIKKNNYDFIGSRDFAPIDLKIKIKEKFKLKDEKGFYFEHIFTQISTDLNGHGHSIKEAEAEYQLEIDNEKNAWYIFDDFYGTDQEKSLIKFIQSKFKSISNNYKEIYLIRNENLCKLYTFKEGQAFMPDFLLYLKNKDNNITYQIFIEPKGEDRIKEQESKQNFLKEIKEYAEISSQNTKYTLIGLPFYNNKTNYLENFTIAFEKEIKVDSKQK